MAEYLRTPGSELPGESGAKRCLVGFSHESLTSGWRKLWRAWYWEARYRRVTIYILSSGRWFECSYIDGQGPQWPKIWGDGSMDLRAQLRASGVLVVDAVVDFGDLPHAQRHFFPMTNLKYAKMLLGIPRGARIANPRPPKRPGKIRVMRLALFAASCVRWGWELVNRGKIRRPAHLAAYLEERNRQRMGRSVATAAPEPGLETLTAPDRPAVSANPGIPLQGYATGR